MMLENKDFHGQIVLRGDPGYEDARVGRVFNARRPERRPDAVLLAESDEDVIRGVRLAVQRGWRVAVRAGGHSWAAWSVRDGGLLIDLGLMRDITFDDGSGVATVRPAVRGGAELAPFLSARGRAFPGGHCETVGLGGFLMQGGQGWNSRAMGWACENVVAVDVVTAGGELLRADETQNQDLYWAVRGAGPGFPGVVTRFHLGTYPKPAVMLQDTWTFRLEDAAPLLGWLHEILPKLRVTVEPVVAATRLPDVPLHDGVSRPPGTVLLLHTTVMGDSVRQIEELLIPFDECPLRERSLGHVRGETDIERENHDMTAQNPENHRYLVDCSWTDATAEELSPLLRRIWSELPTEHSFSIWYGWAPTRKLPDMAFSVEANVYLATYAIYTDPADDSRYADWVHGRVGELARLGRGVYLGDTDFGRRTDRFLAPENFARLREIQAARDPGGLFAGYLVGDATRLNEHD
jgi:FAD/FMN-containing dehydrogenase